MSVAAKHGQPARKMVVCPTAIYRELIRDTHQLAHAGAQRVLTKLQLQWYWPYMKHDVRRRVRQCETCQANKHGRSPGEAAWWTQNVEGPWQVEAVDRVGSVSMTPQRDVARREMPLPSWEARSPPPAPRLPPPLPGSSTNPEVQKPPKGGAPYEDTRETTLPGQHTRQLPVYKKDLVCDRTICGRYKYSTVYRMGRRAKGRGSYEHHANINFCLGGITNEIHAPKTKSPSHVS